MVPPGRLDPSWDDDADDEDLEEEVDSAPDDDDDEPTIRCPECGAEAHEDALQCPQCGEYLFGPQPSAPPLWIVVAIIVCLLLVLLWSIPFWKA